MGLLGPWDQQSFKQTVVTAYSRKMQFIRPFYNLLACMQGNPRLPRAGANINILYAALLSGSKPVFTELLRSEEHTSELQSHSDLVCRLLLEKKKTERIHDHVAGGNHREGITPT